MASMPTARGATPETPLYRRRWFIVSGVLLILVITGSLAQSTTSTKHPSSPTARESTTTTDGDGEDNLGASGAPTVNGSVVASGSGSSAGSVSCRGGDPLANVYHPNRLTVVQPCTTVSGTVKTVRAEDDGDVHFDLALDASFTGMLTSANYADQHGWLVVEIVPADEPGCTPGQAPRPATGTYDYGICSGADETPPTVGSHVYVTGPSVLDEDHGGWAEVHPAWAISSSLTSTTTAPPPAEATAPPATAPPPASPPATTTAATGCYPRTSTGNCYKAGEYCPNADHGTTGVAEDGTRIACVDNDGWRWEPQ